MENTIKLKWALNEYTEDWILSWLVTAPGLIIFNDFNYKVRRAAENHPSAHWLKLRLEMQFNPAGGSYAGHGTEQKYR